MPLPGSTQRHPFVSLLWLLMLVFAGAILFTVIGAVVGGVVYGFPDLVSFFSGSQSANIDQIKLIQIFSSIGMFVLPPIVFARLESVRWQSYLKLNPFIPILFVLTIVLMYFSVPLLDLTVEINKGMKLPGFLKEVEEWMRQKEDQMAELTIQLLAMKTVSALLVNLLMLAVIPAIGEELLFRGCLQRIFQRLTQNHHLAIWVTAFIFSAIHMQFFGFLPRMLLGAMFGYLLVWSNSLWVPILAHFVNNATAVVTAYIYQQQGRSLQELTQNQAVTWPVYLASFIGTSALLWYFYEKAKKQSSIFLKNDGTRLD